MRVNVTSRKDLNWGWKSHSEITSRSRLAKVPRTSVLEVWLIDLYLQQARRVDWVLSKPCSKQEATMGLFAGGSSLVFLPFRNPGPQSSWKYLCCRRQALGGQGAGAPDSLGMGMGQALLLISPFPTAHLIAAGSGKWDGMRFPAEAVIWLLANSPTPHLSLHHLPAGAQVSMDISSSWRHTPLSPKTLNQRNLGFHFLGD